MKDQMEYLLVLLKADDLVRGYVDLTNVKAAIRKELRALDEALAPPKPVAILSDRTAPIFPETAGVEETDTTRRI